MVTALRSILFRPLAVVVAPARVALVACEENRTFVDPAMYAGPDGGRLECVPNLDGRIDATELRAAIGVPVSFLVSPAGTTRDVDLAGIVDASGVRVWDWSGAAPDDQLARIAAAAMAGRWYASEFPRGEFAAPLDPAGAVEGIYEHTDEHLVILGYASTSPDPGSRTLVRYGAPVVLYRFPLTVGASHVSSGEIRDATVRGLPFAGQDTYEVNVDTAGRLELPDLTFEQVLRVRTRVTIAPAVGMAIERHQTAFVFECFGEVARATSRDNEAAVDFTTAGEVRRLSL